MITDAEWVAAQVAKAPAPRQAAVDTIARVLAAVRKPGKSA